MTVEQSPVLKITLPSFGPKGVRVASTRETTGHAFHLTTLMVIDEFGSGFPVAWCLSNHEESSVFFNMIKKNSGGIIAK